MTVVDRQPPVSEPPDPPRKRDRTHWLYIAVIAAVFIGVAVGLLAPEVGKSVGVLGTMFVALIKMMIAPVIFCTIVLGIGSVRKAATVGKVGGLAFAYFLVMSTFALAIGLVVGNVVGQTGWTAVTQLLTLMLGFYITCILFVFGVLGTLLRVVSGVSIFKLVRYLAREYLLIVSTSSSESALPRLIAKLEHLGVDRSTVGVVVPTGYSFNLDGTAIYLTMASLFIADALGSPLSVG